MLEILGTNGGLLGTWLSQARTALAGTAMAALMISPAAADVVSFAVAPNPPNITLIAAGIAEGEGYFKQFNVETNLERLASGILVFRGLEAGQVDMGAFDFATLPAATVQGSKIKLIYTATSRKQLQLVVSKDVTACADLRGKVLAIDEVGAVLELLTRQFLATCGLVPADVTYASVGGGSVAALVSGQASAAVLSPERLVEIRQLANGPEVNVLASFAELLPDFPGTAWGATQATIEGKRDQLVGLVAALIRANEFLRNPDNKDAVIRYMVEFCKIKQETAEAAYPVYKELDLWPHGIGVTNKTAEFSINQLVAEGRFTADKAPSFDALVDTSIYEAAEKLAK